MRKRGVYLMLVVLAVVGVLVAVFSRREREPEYGGKRLSQWVEGYATSIIMDGKRKPTEEAANAIRQAGTNAIPFLLEWIRYEPPAWKTRFYEVVNCAAISDRKGDLASGAIDAFGVLGPEAQRAIPELVTI